VFKACIVCNRLDLQRRILIICEDMRVAEDLNTDWRNTEGRRKNQRVMLGLLDLNQVLLCLQHACIGTSNAVDNARCTEARTSTSSL
jgi:hypothetical protein